MSDIKIIYVIIKSIELVVFVVSGIGVVTDIFKRQNDTEMMFIWQSSGRNYLP